MPPVALVWGDTPTCLAGATAARGLWQAAPRAFLLSVPRVARYHITPDAVTVTPAPEADDASVRAVLFGAVMGALLHLRGILALHSSALRLPNGGAVLFAGASTAGKSTLAAALAQQGYPLLADDLAAVHFDAQGAAWVYPGLARCKLWADALAKLALAPASGERLQPQMEKYVLPLTTWSEPEPLTYLYELCPQEQGQVTLTPVQGMAKMRLLDRQTYRPSFVEGLGLQAAHLRRIGQLAPQVALRQITRPRGQPTLEAIISLLQQDWA